MKPNRRRMTAAVLACMIFISMAVAACGKKTADDTGKQTLSSGWENPFSDKRPDSDYVVQVPNVKTKLKAAKDANSDVVGWLQVPGTTLDEAVVQGKDNEFYYRLDINKNYSFSGSLWMDMDCKPGDGNAENFSQNTIIYGHNLGKPQGVKDDPEGVKFAQLLKFDDLEFARQHPYFYFTTEAGAYVYEIFTVFYSEDITSPVEYHHADYAVDDYKQLLADLRNRSQFDYNVTVGAKDKVMTLSTCTYKYGTYTQNPHARFVVMGKLVTDGERYYETADLAVNPDPKQPDFKK